MGRIYEVIYMNKKTSQKKLIPKPKNTFTCRWCSKEQSENNFFKSSLDNHANICKSCIKKKFNYLLSVCGKEKALFICCHYLNLAYFADIAVEFDIAQGLGYYIRLLNLRQNQCPDDFEKGIIKGYSECFVPIDNTDTEMKKKRLTEIISELEEVRNEI